MWLYDGENGDPRDHILYQGYGGFDLIARQYKKRNGEHIPILPIGFSKSNNKIKVKIGNPSTVEDNETESSNTDWFMNKIAELLPEDQRGYYRNFK